MDFTALYYGLSCEYGLKGEYTGKLLVIMDDTTNHVMHNEAGTWERKVYRDSVADFKYSVSPLTTDNPATTHVTLAETFNDA